jgi:hypothetical protein
MKIAHVDITCRGGGGIKDNSKTSHRKVAGMVFRTTALCMAVPVRK